MAATPPELDEALEQINAIRGQLATAETFRGYRAVSVAGTGLVAVVTSLAQPVLVPNPAADPVAYVVLWVGAAVICTLGAGGQILHDYLKCQSPHRRASTRIVLGHLVPAVVAGAAVTWAFMTRSAASVEQAHLLPGLWAILVGLGIFASRRHLPRTIGWVGLYYLLSGAVILKFLPGPEALAPWVMGAIFGLGQLASALVLYWNLERNGANEEI